MPRTPEQEARAKIDTQLADCGSFVQDDAKKADFSAGRGIALREVRMTAGPCDYLLLVDRNPVGVIEAKKEGTTLSTVADQSTSYANNVPEYLDAKVPPPFRYESTGVETFFREARDPAPRSRRVFTFHRPETLGSKAGRFADLVSLVRFPLQQQPVLTPIADWVQERYERWLRQKEERGVVFSAEQRAWLDLIRDHIATILSIEPDDLDYAPFSHRGGRGRAHQLFGTELPRLLDELNERLAA